MPPAGATTLPATIAESMTLTASGSPYTGTSTTISEGITVTAEPGATIKLTGSLTSKGTLDVNGTAEQPVLFTSSKDTAAGQWTGIVLQAGAGASSLSHAEVRYAKTGIAVSGGISPTILNSTVRDNSLTGISAASGSTQINANHLMRNPSGIVVSGNGNPEIAENTIEDCTGYGISQTISEKQSAEVRIHDNVVERCGSSSKASIYVFAGGYTNHLTGVTLADNTIAGGNGRAIDYYTKPYYDSVPADIDENTITGNASNAVWVAGKLSESTTWENHGFVIVPEGGYEFEVGEGAVLTLGPGLVVKPSGGVAHVTGELIAEGTEAEPITITSIRDDSAGGDTNMDGSATLPAPGDYRGFVFSNGTASREPGRGALDYVNAKFGGAGAGCGQCGGGGPMFSFGGQATGGPSSPPSTIQHATFADSEMTAVSGSGSVSEITDSTFVSDGGAIAIAAIANPQITGNSVADVGEGIVVSGNGNPEIAENTIEDCTGYGISQTISEKQSAEVRIHDNVVERCGSSSKASIYVFAGGYTNHLTGVTLAGNTIAGGNGRAIDYYTKPYYDTVPADIDENMITGNASNAVWVAGKLNESTTWENHGFVIVPEGGYEFEVGESAALTLGPGLVVKPSGGVAHVTGELIAEGTEAEPITITSIRDDSIGGDTNMDGTATLPEPGDYRGFAFTSGTASRPPGRGALEYVHAEFGGAGSGCGQCGGGGPMFDFAGANKSGPSATPSSIQHSSFEYSVRPAISGAGNFSQITDNSFVSNEEAAVSITSVSDAQITGNSLAGNGEGIIVSGEGNPIIAENRIEDCTGSGISQTIGEKQTAEVRIHDNVVERCGSEKKASIYVFASGYASHVTGVTLADNTIVDGNGRAVDYYTSSDDTVPPDIGENTISGNASNAVWVAGELTESATWGDNGFVIVPEGGYNFRIGEDATLTLGPGLVIKPSGGALYVDGQLIAEGAPTEPITFTSIKDDSVGGDTNMDGSATLPAPGDYTGIVYSNASGDEFDYVAFHFAATAIDIKYLNSMWIGHSDFIGNEAAIKVAETAENDPQLESLSCVPPYLSFVVSADNWYGTAGLPTPNIDVSEFLEPELPEEYASLFEQGASLAAEIASFYPSGDTIPFKIYSCPVLGIPPTPVTPVLITSIPATPWFS